MEAVHTAKPVESSEAASTPRAKHRENCLLAALPATNRRELTAQFELVELSRSTVLCEAGETLKHIYFPIGCVIGTVYAIDAQSSIGISLLGAEGALVSSSLRNANLRALVLHAGSALRMPAKLFLQQLKRRSALEEILRDYLSTAISDLSHMVACHYSHAIDSRLARWLLLAQDRTNSNSFHLTHSTLAYLVGARRESISTVAIGFQRRRLVSYCRGDITIVDDHGLRAIACQCSRRQCARE